ncbi:MAG: Hpt domain-containing protein [Verrucomicrobiia bacterium]|jgi:HPt (histidine-containing phosphotransfer) domain-containing protein
METDAPVLDPAALDKLLQLGGADFVREMVKMFFGYADERLTIARSALAAGRMAEIEPAIHPLKTSAGHVGAQAMSYFCQEIERNGRDEIWDPMPELLSAAEKSYAEVKPLLEARLETL